MKGCLHTPFEDKAKPHFEDKAKPHFEDKAKRSSIKKVEQKIELYVRVRLVIECMT